MTAPEASRRRDRRAHMRAIGSLGGLARAAAYDGREMMAPARAAFASSFERTVRERFPELTDEVEIARRADALKRLHYARMAFRSAEVRRRKSARARATDRQSEGTGRPE
jgi:hypothetical protein